MKADSPQRLYIQELHDLYSQDVRELWGAKTKFPW
jgi:hypothetical protein